MGHFITQKWKKGENNFINKPQSLVTIQQSLVTFQ